MASNLDLVRSIYAAWERGDYSSTDWAHPDIEYVYPDGPAPGTFTGVRRMTEGTREWLSAFEEFRTNADEYRELDHERVLVLSHGSGRGKTSGIELQNEGAELFHVRGGVVTRLVMYADRKRALADLGLAAEADPTRSPD